MRGQKKRLDLSQRALENLEAVPLPAYLTQLNLQKNHLSRLPARMASCTRLERLALGFNHFTDVPPVLAALPALKGLSLNCNPLEAVSGARLPPSLVDLDLTSSGLAAFSLDLASQPALRLLDLEDNALSALSLSNHSSGGALEILVLSDNPGLDVPGTLAQLAALPRLTRLCIGGCGPAEAVIEGLGRLSTLEDLILSDSPLSAAWTVRFAQALAQAPSLREVRFTCHDVTQAQIDQLKAIAPRCELHVLQLDGGNAVF